MAGSVGAKQMLETKFLTKREEDESRGQNRCAFGYA